MLKLIIKDLTFNKLQVLLGVLIVAVIIVFAASCKLSMNIFAVKE